MPKKTLSDLILNFDNAKKSGGFVQKTYIPAKQLTKQLGKKVVKPPITDTQKKVDYKKEYEQLLYKDLYKQTRPQPKDVLEAEDFYKILQNQKKMIKDTTERPLTEKDIAELLGEIGEYEAYEASESVPYVRPSRRRPLSELTPSRIAPKDIDAGSFYMPFAGSDVSGYEKIRPRFAYGSDIIEVLPGVNPSTAKLYNKYGYPERQEINYYRMQPEEIGVAVPSYEPPEHDYDNEALRDEYERNDANFEIMGRPKKAFLPQEEGYERFIFQSAEAEDIPYSQRSIPSRIQDWESRSVASLQSEPGAKYSRGKAPGSAVGRKKGPEARKAKAAAKKAESVISQSSLILPSETERTGLLSGRGLKKKATRGGKISVGNLSKFFKSSYAGKKAPKQIDTYNLDSELTNKYGSVYYDPDKNHAVLTHKGTSGDTYLETAKDWGNNAAYAMGLYKYTDRYKQGKKLQTATEKKYGSQNVSTLGHSQGSHLSRELGGNSKEIINLNPAYKGEKPLKNEYNIRSSGDVVSVGLHGTKRGHDVLIPAESANPLTEHKIDILDRINQSQMVGQGLYNPHLRFRIPPRN